MLSIPVHKDISEYEPKVVGGLTLRTLGALGGSVAFSAAFGWYLTFVLGVPVEDMTWAIWAAAVPPVLFGFWTPCGMPFERFLPIWAAYVTGPSRLLYRSPRVPQGPQRPFARCRAYERLEKRPGVETWAPGDEARQED